MSIVSLVLIDGLHPAAIEVGNCPNLKTVITSYSIHYTKLYDKEQLPRAGLYAVNVRCGQQGVKGVARIAAQAETGTGKTSVEVYMRDFVSRRGETSLSVDFLETLPGEFRIPGLKMPFNDLACDVPHFHQWQGLNKPKTGQQPYSLI